MKVKPAVPFGLRVRQCSPEQIAVMREYRRKKMRERRADPELRKHDNQKRRDWYAAKKGESK